MIEIKSFERKDNKKGRWLVLKGLNEKGEERTWNVFDDGPDSIAIIDGFKGPGKYEGSFIKKGEYWNLKTLVPVSVGSAPSTNGTTTTTAPTSAKAPGRTEVALECIRAAAQVFQGTGDKGGDGAESMAKAFMTVATDFISGKFPMNGKSASSSPEGA